MRTHHNIFVLVIVAFSMPVLAVEYSCEVTRKIDRELDYTNEQVAKSQFSNRVEELNESSFISRCSFVASAGKVTCDRYKVDKVAFDKNVKIKKYYHFQSQFDFQLFPDLSFIENNGRGSVSYGKCTLVSP